MKGNPSFTPFTTKRSETRAWLRKLIISFCRWWRSLDLSRLRRNKKEAHDTSMGRRVCLPRLTVESAGKYTVRPMDPSWEVTHASRPSRFSTPKELWEPKTRGCWRFDVWFWDLQWLEIPMILGEGRVGVGPFSLLKFAMLSLLVT